MTAGVCVAVKELRLICAHSLHLNYVLCIIQTPLCNLKFNENFKFNTTMFYVTIIKVINKNFMCKYILNGNSFDILSNNLL